MLHLTLWALRMPVSLPFDVVFNAWPVDAPAESVREPDGRRRLVVLQHGLWRSPWSLWRIERALREAGYDVANPGYPSTEGRIEDFAAGLADVVEAEFDRDPPAELYFVGHSMGGLVVQDYLRRPGARQPTACVFLATPHRGAVLADLRMDWWLFRLVMGDGAARQLSIRDPLHEEPIVMPCPAGTLVGSLGSGNPSIPGDDDGTVGVLEATWPGASDCLLVPVGHTRIAVTDQSIGLVLRFLARRSFD
jgi:triacylglycerol lipase